MSRTHREGRLASVSAALVLGGTSSRMGRDKAAIEVEGEPLATRTARLLEGLFEDVMLVGGEPPAEAPGRRVADSDGPRCALRGLVTALGAAREERVVVVATDLPHLTSDLLLALTAWPEADAVVPRDAAGVHALCAIYRREPVLDVARERLAAENLAMGGLLDAIETSYLEGEVLGAVAPEGRALTNWNRPEDLEAP